VIGLDDIGLLNGDGIVPVLDKKGIIYRLRTRANETLKRRLTDEL